MNKQEVEEIIEEYDRKELAFAPVPIGLLIDVLKALIKEEPEGIQEDEYGL